MSVQEQPIDRAFAAALDAVPMPVVVVSRDYRYLAFNKAHAAQVGALYGAHIEVGDCVLDSVGAEADRQSIRANYERALAGEEFSDEVWRGEGAERRHYSTKYAPLVRDGRIVGVTAVGLDTTEVRRAREQAVFSRQAILNAVPEPAIAIDRELRYLAFNDAWLSVLKRAYGTTAEVGQPYLDSIGDETDREQARGYFDRILAGETLRTSDWRGEPGSRRHWTAIRSPMWSDGEIVGIVSIALDTTEAELHRQAVEERSKRATERAALLDEVIETARDAMIVCDLGGVICEFNREAERMTGFSAAEAIGHDLAQLIGQEDAAEMNDVILRALGGEEVEIARVAQRRKDGGLVELSMRVVPVRDESDAVTGVSCSWAPLDVAAFLDPLTTLTNRRGLMEFGLHAVAQANRVGERVGLLFADIDHMKAINDAYGHLIGDRALKDVAEILRSTTREADIVARIGGDEFVVLTVGDAPEGLGTLRQRFQRHVEAYKAVHDRPYELSVSCGIASSEPPDTCDMEELLGQADEAMYADKRRHAGASLVE